MRLNGSVLELSATDLAHHLACRHLVELERAAAEGRAERPYRSDPALELLIRRGIEHEEAYVRFLQDQGREVVHLRDVDGEDAFERTQEAMRQGAGVIVQGALADGRWRGRADLLIRVNDLPSHLGDWSYEVADTKLARQTRGESVLQLALYTDMLSRLQGVVSRRFHVVKPSSDPARRFEIESFRFEDFQAYYRLVRRRLTERVDASPDDSSYPHPVPHCEICGWWSQCDRRRRDDDHLSLVAGMQRLHTEELNRQGITTLTGFAERAKPLDERPERGSRDTFTRLHAQACIQLQGRRQNALVYELLPVEPDRGLCRLPEPSPGDVFFDIEADPFVGLSGLEYLFGYLILNQKEEPEYDLDWARNGIEEKQIFEGFLDFLMNRWDQYPDMHVYHFSPYEPGALKRLMGRHAAREDEVDRLLRGERFIDLHAITRQALRASVESYSLKNLEPLFEFERGLPLPEARVALQRVNCALELGIPAEIREQDRQAVEAYNRDDCLSTLRLREWLEVRRSELIASGGAISRPELKDGQATERIQERRAEVQAIHDRLVEGLPGDRDSWNEIDRARFLLANLLDYFRREDKCAWWERFRLNDLEHEDLLDERKAISGLEFVGEVEGGTARCPVHRYRFPVQEVAIDPGSALFEVGEDNPVGTVQAIDYASRRLDIKKRQDSSDKHPFAVMAFERVSPDIPDAALLALAESVAEHGVDGNGPFRAARDLLLRRPPRIEGVSPGEVLRNEDETADEAAVRIVPQLNCTYLAIQGPPGTGKTYTGARMIARLLEQGKRIGVTAVSHKVIQNLLQAAIEAGEELGVRVEAVHKVSNRDQEEETEKLKQTTDNSTALGALDDGKVVGGTCWLWARDDAVERLDYLFVDEAGQLSLAMMLAAARSARNLVLLGDPQQLEQPQQASHPDGAEVSALEHVLGGRQTILDDRGLFLDKTWRLHPAICAFTSELYYEGRLESREGLEQQAIEGETRFQGSGLFLEPVEHQGNQNRSLQEVEAIRGIVDDLLAPDTYWVDLEGKRHPLTENDILVIAPYNAQVGALIDALPAGVRVGTVDRFQGQEAPVVIYSMTSSSANDAPRGMSFLYNPNRFNVATSRARCICIVLGSPALLEPECHTPEQMRWANAFCRFREMAAHSN